MNQWLIGMGIKNRRRILLWPMLMCATAAPVQAAPYWVAWEGDDFPENEGWLREGEGTRADRTLSAGIMTLDSLARDESVDIYRIYGASDPEPGEEFVVQWGLRVNEVDWDSPLFQYDPGWAMDSADGWRATFAIGEDELHNLLEQIDVNFEPGVFHDWEFRSSDMRTFTISLDGLLVSSGTFVNTGFGARMSWGDLGASPTSSSDWDYFRFGVVPEPATSLSMMALALLYKSRKRQ